MAVKIRFFNHISTKEYTKEQAGKLVLELRESYGYENVEVVEWDLK